MSIVNSGDVRLPYRSDIDGLRAVAVTVVVLFHAFPNFFPGGFIGVDVFFVISGYLISAIIFSERGIGKIGSGRFSFKEFYIRRACRILPALLIMLTFALIAAWFILLPDDFRRFGGHIRGAGFYVSNLVLKKEVGYFDVAAETKPLLHLWSLAIEEQFYIIWPVIAVAISLGRRKSLLFVAVLIMLSCSINVVNVNIDQVSVFYMPWTRAWELLSGSLLARFEYISLVDSHWRLRGFFRRLSPSLIAMISFVTIIACVFIYTQHDAFPGWRAIAPVGAATLLIGAGPGGFVSSKILSHPSAVFVGRISYPLYLWHWPLFSFARISAGGELSPLLSCALILMAVGLSWLTYRLIETPVRVSQFRGTIALSLTGVCLAFGGLGDLMTHMRNASFAARFHLESVLNAIGENETFGDMVRVSFPDLNIDVFKRDGSGGAVLFLGDSNMEQYASRIDHLLKADPRGNKSAFFMTVRGCLPLPNTSDNSGCETFFDQSREVANRLNVDTVVIAAQWWGYFVDQMFRGQFAVGGLDLGSVEGRARGLQSVGNSVRFFTERGKKVFVVLNIPVGPHMDPRNRITRSFLNFSIHDEGEPRSEFLARYGEINRGIAQAAQSAGATIIDPMDSLCGPGDWCAAQQADGSPIYRDATHLRPSFTRLNVRYLDATLRNSR